MKKIAATVAGLVLVTVMGGCQITPQQAQVIAQQAGTFTAVGWIAADNPSTDTVAAVSAVIGMIRSKCSAVSTGETYTAVVYPEVAKLIATQVQPQFRPLAQTVTLTMLGAIDTLFALHPEWQTSQAQALTIANAFLDGATAGLGLSANHPALVKVRAVAKTRTQLLNRR